MASARSPRGAYALLAVVVVVILAVTNVWNPWPKLWNWFDTSGPIADKSARWQQTIGGTPQRVEIAGDTVVVSYRTSVDAFDVTTGARLWHSDANWATVAGQGAGAVVVTGRLLIKGYQVLDPRTGAVQRTDDAATAVWTYRDAVLDLHCATGDDCTLTAWPPRGGKQLWNTGTGGIGFVLNASNPDLPDTKQIGSPQVDDNAAGPPALPAGIGLPEGDKVRIVDTASGSVVRTVTVPQGQRVAVTGRRVLTVTGLAQDGTCYYSVTAADMRGGETVWSREGLNLRTAGNGTACKQDRDPAGGEDVILGVDPYGRQELINAADGRNLWHGDKGDTVLAVDDKVAVIRTADKKTLRAYGFAAGRIVWSRPAAENTTVALTPSAAIISSASPWRVVAVGPTSGAVRADVRTQAKVFAVGSGGFIVVDGRQMAYLPFG